MIPANIEHSLTDCIDSGGRCGRCRGVRLPPANADDPACEVLPMTAKMTQEPSVDSALPALLREQASKQPAAAALLAPGRPPLTYADLWGQVQYIAGALRAQGVTSSTRVAVVLPNGPEMAATFLGVAACAVCAPLNPAYQAAELRFYLEDTRAEFVIVGKGERGPVLAVARDMNLGVLEIDADPSLPAGRFSIGSLSRDGAGAPSFSEASPRFWRFWSSPFLPA